DVAQENGEITFRPGFYALDAGRTKRLSEDTLDDYQTVPRVVLSARERRLVVLALFGFAAVRPSARHRPRPIKGGALTITRRFISGTGQGVVQGRHVRAPV